MRSLPKAVGRGRRSLSAACAGLAVALGIGIGSWLAAAGPAAAGDKQAASDIPDFEIRIMRGGREIELSGGIGPGINDALIAALEKAPRAQVIHLDSSGGLLDEGRMLYRTIRRHGLTTYVYNACASACVMAFMAGRPRLIAADAKIGFHQASSTGGPQDAKLATMLYIEFLAGAGIGRPLLDHASTVDNKSMWYPSEEELRAANVITDVVPDDRFAASGLGTDIDTAKVETTVDEAFPVLGVLRRRDNSAYMQIVEQFLRQYRAGATWEDIRSKLYGVVDGYVARDIALADDDVLHAVGQFLVDELRVLAVVQPDACHSYPIGIGGEIIGFLPESLQDLSLQLGSRIVSTATVRQRLPADAADRLWTRVFAAMEERATAGQMALLAAEPARLQPSQSADYCAMAASLYESILELPSADAAALLRTTFETPVAAVAGAR